MHFTIAFLIAQNFLFILIKLTVLYLETVTVYSSQKYKSIPFIS